MNLVWLAISGVGLVMLAASIAAVLPHPTSHAGRRWCSDAERVARLALLDPVANDATRQPRRRHPRRTGLRLGAGDAAVAAGVVVAMILKLVTERIVRRRMQAYLAVRERPGTSQPGAVLRGDVPSAGPSFPSGHVLLVTVIACVIATTVTNDWVWVSLSDRRAGHRWPCLRRRAQPARRHCRPRRPVAARRRPRRCRRLSRAGCTAPSWTTSGGRARRRSGDLPLFRRTLCRLSYSTLWTRAPIT